MKRDQWLPELYAALERTAIRRLRYGRADCCQFCAQIVHAMTGVDYRERFPAYRGRRAALALLHDYGGMAGLISSVLGNPKPGPLAARGDVVAMRIGGCDACGVCLGTHCVTVGPRGLVYQLTGHALHAWSV